MNFLKQIGCTVVQLLRPIVRWWWSKTYTYWQNEWNAPSRGLRLIYLFFGLIIALVLIPEAFKSMGIIGGISYLITLFVALSNATFFRMVKINRTNYIPLGLVAPIVIFVGVAGSGAIKSLLGDAGRAARTGDFVGAAIILIVFAIFTLLFNKWKSGNPYDVQPVKKSRRKQ